MIIRNQEPIGPSGLSQVKARRKTAPKIKFSTIAVYASVFVLIVSILSIGYNQPQSVGVVANVANTGADSIFERPSVDTIVAVDVASGIAEVANLPIATNVSNLAVTVKSKSEVFQPDGISVTKPQIIETIAENRLVTNYVIVEGDTIASLAKKFNISEQTIKWANNLSSDYISVGSSLKILPIDGVLYSVKESDTIAAISEKYSVDQTRLVLYNDLDISGLTPNTSIILPDGVLPENERPGYVAPVVYSFYAGISAGYNTGRTWYISTGTASGSYAYGNCTLYAYNRRVQLGLPVGTNWGHAASWAYSARAAGLIVNNTPSVGAIMQNGGGFGHVAVVESIAENGDVTISEMNASYPGGGYNIVSGRIVNAANAAQYLYIH